ncbi:hypothetical protein [Rhodopseudomonas palustris]|uniref:hypothetical protein n=1 Tax=Rhodopseudomonas palustris TaxID=1076 RepID=UPI001F1CC114|nr:hypothetical protein [Rhodopseudomonas palustris]
MKFSAEMWPTPIKSDCEGGPDLTQSERGSGAPTLKTVSVMWPTACVTDSNGARNRTSGRSNPDSKHHDGVTLNDAVLMWPTCTARDWRSIEASEATHDRNARPLSEFVGQWDVPTTTLRSILPDHPISTVGEESSHIRRTLNPLFVEWLMGWPRGWTCLALTPPALNASACSETALCRYRQLMRFALSQLASPPPAPPAQLTLFG